MLRGLLAEFPGLAYIAIQKVHNNLAFFYLEI